MGIKYTHNLIIFLLIINYSYIYNKNISSETQFFQVNQQQQETTESLRKRIAILENLQTNLTDTINENEVIIAKNQMYIIILFIIVIVFFLIICVYSIFKIRNICTRQKENDDLLNTIIAEFDNGQNILVKNNNEEVQVNRSYDIPKKPNMLTVNPDAFVPDPNDKKLYRPYSANEID